MNAAPSEAARPLGIEEALSDKATMGRIAMKQAEQEAADLELLHNGEWLDVVMEALGEEIAGEEDIRKFCIYSVAATMLDNGHFGHNPLLHIFLTGDSGAGKTWVLARSLPILLHQAERIQLTDLSAKGLDYLADESGDPNFFRGKVLFIDEAADKSKDTMAKLKVVMNIGQAEVSNLTVDDKKKSRRQSFTAMPTIWTASAEAIEDAERQFLNRPFILSADSSEDQTKKVQDMQKARAALGSFYTPVSKKTTALRLMDKIREEKNAEVVVLFSDYYCPDDERSKSMIPQFDSLVKAIAFAHRFDRPTITASDGHMVIFATWEDGIEATKIWGKFVKHKTTHLAERFLVVLERLNRMEFTKGQTYLDTGFIENKGKTLEQIHVELSSMGKQWTIGYVRNMLSQLSKEGLAEYHEDESGKNRWVALSHPSHSSHFVCDGNFSDSGKMLDERILELKNALITSSQENMTKGVELPENLRDLILEGASLDYLGIADAALADRPSLDEKVNELMRILKEDEITEKGLLEQRPDLAAVYKRVKEGGRVRFRPGGIVEWAN